MGMHEKDLPMTYALNDKGKLVHVLSVQRGLACNCHCKECKGKLIAKHGNEDGRTPHFAHQAGAECKGSYMSHLHMRAQDIIYENKSVMAPAYSRYNRRKAACKFDFVYTNKEDTRWDGIKPDVVGKTADGKLWAIEIFYTNKVNTIKENKIINLNISCLEIDITGQTFESLESFLLNSYQNRWWINNPIYDQILYKKEWESVARITNVLLNKPAIKIPDHSLNKQIQSHDIQYVSKDELNTIIKLQTIDGCVYAVFVGTYDTVNRLYDQSRNYFHNYTGVLAVYTDFTLSCDIELKKDYDYKWLQIEIVNFRNNQIENSIRFNTPTAVHDDPDEIRYREYIENTSKYLVLPYTGIAYICELQKDCKHCDCCKDIVKHNGELFAVCDSIKLKNSCSDENLGNKTQSQNNNQNNYPKPLGCETLEDFNSFLKEKGILNWKGNDNHVEDFILSNDKNELFVMHYHKKDIICFLSRFTWKNYNYNVETKSGSYDYILNELVDIKTKMNNK